MRFYRVSALIGGAIFLVAVGNVFATTKGLSMKEIRTYTAFTFPIDPVRIESITDMNLSYSLASTLVEWSRERHVTTALAERWSVEDAAVRFTLRKGARWSDGSPVTSEEVRLSLFRAIKIYPEDVRSLTNLLEGGVGIECPAENQIVFRLAKHTTPDALLKKLTEPNFGVLKIRSRTEIDLKVTTGSYSIQSVKPEEVVLRVNPHWHRYRTDMAELVTLRRPTSHEDPEIVLFNDTWPNLQETSSLISAESLTRYKREGYSVWTRPVDKVFLFFLGNKRSDQARFELLRFLRDRMNRSKLTAGLTGFTLTDQMFTSGYNLHIQKPHYATEGVQLPEVFKGRAVEVLLSPARVSPKLQENLRQVLLEATGTEPKFIKIGMESLRKQRLEGEFDFYAGTLGMADPDVDGVMSYYLEGETPTIPSSKANNFVARLDTARLEKDEPKKIQAMRGILNDAVSHGHVLPLFHLSSVGIGRPELDFSAVPATDESVTLSQVRVRSKAK